MRSIQTSCTALSTRPNPSAADSVQLEEPQRVSRMVSTSAPHPAALHDPAALDALQLEEVAAAHGFALTPFGEPARISSTKKMKKRCAKWPDCPFGEGCRFIHPAEMCMNWPRCPFGDACFYIHPEVPCKFGESV